MTLRMPPLRMLPIYAILVAMLVATALACIAFAERVPQPLIDSRTLAIDWQGIHRELVNGQVKYDGGIGNPPWTALIVVPLGFLSMRASWGLLLFLTLVVEVVSVPRVGSRWLYYLGICLLVFSYPSLRHAVDGNFEGLVIGGVCLCLLGYQKHNPFIVAAGVLLATGKPQEVLLFMAVLALYMFQTWKKEAWLKAGACVLAVVIPTMLWLGRDWLTFVASLPTMGSLMDMSLRAAFNRAQLPGAVYLLAWLILFGISAFLIWKSNRTFSREKAGMLVALSLLLAPYSAGNSILAVLAIGVIPLFLKRPLLGFALVILSDAAFLFGQASQAYYATFVVLVLWSVLAWCVWREYALTAQLARAKLVSAPLQSQQL